MSNPYTEKKSYKRLDRHDNNNGPRAKRSLLYLLAVLNQNKSQSSKQKRVHQCLKKAAKIKKCCLRELPLPGVKGQRSEKWASLEDLVPLFVHSEMRVSRQQETTWEAWIQRYKNSHSSSLRWRCFRSARTKIKLRSECKTVTTSRLLQQTDGAFWEMDDGKDSSLGTWVSWRKWRRCIRSWWRSRGR